MHTFSEEVTLFIRVGVVMVIETVTCDIVFVGALAEGGGADMHSQMWVRGLH